MFHLNKALNDFLKYYNIKFEIIDNDSDNNNYQYYVIEYLTKVIINNNNYYFIIYEIMNKDYISIELIYYHNIYQYRGKKNIFNKIIKIINNDLIIHEINYIENQLVKEEEFINKIDLQIKGSANLMSKFSLPADIALLCFT